MNDSLKIKSKLEEIQARPVKLPTQMSPHEIAALIGERELLLSIAIQLEKQNLFLLEELKMEDSKKEERVIRPFKKDIAAK